MLCFIASAITNSSCLEELQIAPSDGNKQSEPKVASKFKLVTCKFLVYVAIVSLTYFESVLRFSSY